MPKRFDLLNDARLLWPPTLNLDDAVLNEGEVLAIPSLVAAYDAIEERIGEDNDWAQLGAWAFHQALWSEAVAALRAGQRTISSGRVSFEAFDEKMRENLNDPSWTEERGEYLGAD
jgi:hypothetical protein